MCALFTLRLSPEELVQRLSSEFSLEVPLPDFQWGTRILPHQIAPVLIENQQHLHLVPMSFSLIPSWSKTPRVKFATHNARVETLIEKPTWRTVLKTRHCAVPMTGFVEPIYENQFAGNMVQFQKVKDSLLVAAGLWDSWVDRETGEVKDSFTIITGPPPEFVAKIGHDRCPIFLKADQVKNWTHIHSSEKKDWISFLNTSNWQGDFQVSVDRPMKPGWQKRI